MPSLAFKVRGTVKFILNVAWSSNLGNCERITRRIILFETLAVIVTS